MEGWKAVGEEEVSYQGQNWRPTGGGLRREEAVNQGVDSFIFLEGGEGGWRLKKGLKGLFGKPVDG